LLTHFLSFSSLFTQTWCIQQTTTTQQQLKETKQNKSSTRSDVTNQISCDKNIENRKTANADYVTVSQQTTLYQHTQNGKRIKCRAT